jgi:hypothetical protein
MSQLRAKGVAVLLVEYRTQERRLRSRTTDVLEREDRDERSGSNFNFGSNGRCFALVDHD